MKNEDYITQMAKFEVLLDMVQKRSQNIETQVDSIKELIQTDIVKEFQKLALEMRELKVNFSTTDGKIKELDARVSELEKEKTAQMKNTNHLWVTGVMGIITVIISVVLTKYI